MNEQQQRQHAQADKDPFVDDIKTAVKVGLASGSAGFLFGGAVGILKALPTFLSAGATSLQAFGLGTVFTQTRLTIIRAWTTEEQAPSPGELTTATAMAGGFSGGAMGALFRGRKNIIPGAIMWSIFGATGQVLYNNWLAVPQRVESRGPGFWKRMSDKSWTPFTVLSNEEYAEMLKEKMLKVDVELSILDDKIAAMKERQKVESLEERQNDEGLQETVSEARNG